MKVTAVALVSESTDHYADAWKGHLSIEEIRTRIDAEYGDEASHIYIDAHTHREL
jgi:hypothetical protein